MQQEDSVPGELTDVRSHIHAHGYPGEQRVDASASEFEHPGDGVVKQLDVQDDDVIVHEHADGPHVRGRGGGALAARTRSTHVRG